MTIIFVEGPAFTRLVTHYGANLCRRSDWVYTSAWFKRREDADDVEEALRQYKIDYDRAETGGN